MENNFTELSKKIIKKIDSSVIKQNGIYFTPQSIIKKNLEIIMQIDNIVIEEILEPSCGSCEFINLLNEMFSNKNITGIENNNKIYEKIKKIIFENNKIKIINDDYLKWDNDKMYDLIIGNPPYFVIKKKNVEKKYYTYFDGRPNIFILFIIKSIEKLNQNGILSFVLPSNFLNCLYYNKVRQLIYNNYNIIDIIKCDNDKYIQTQQNTIIFIIQKSTNQIKNNNEFTIHIDNYSIFNTRENIIKLKKLYENTTTLSKLNFDVNVGNIVWNQCKNILTNNITNTRLIYASDISDQKLYIKKYKNNDKKNYIDKCGNNDILLVLNRGYGKGSYKLEYCLIDVEYEYLVENHLICIKYIKNVSKKKLLKIYNKIIKSFNNPKTNEFIKIYFENNAINTTELKQILPIYNLE